MDILGNYLLSDKGATAIEKLNSGGVGSFANPLYKEVRAELSDGSYQYSGITVKDSNPGYIKELSVHGFCHQNGTPSPTNKIDINYLISGTSVKLNGVTVGTCPPGAARYAIGDVADTYDIISGMAVNAISEAYYEGAAGENWGVHTIPTVNTIDGGTGYVYKTSVATAGIAEPLKFFAVCNYLQSGLGPFTPDATFKINSIYGDANGGVIYVVVDSNYNTLAKWTAFLASKASPLTNTFKVLYIKYAASFTPGTSTEVWLPAGTNIITNTITNANNRDMTLVYNRDINAANKEKYTKTESDNKYPTKSDVYAKSEADTTFIKKAAGTVTTDIIASKAVTNSKLADDVFIEQKKAYSNALTDTKSGQIVTNPNILVKNPFISCTVLGETKEVGTGDKSPTNPYTLTAAQPTKLTSCGKNLVDITNVLFNYVDRCVVANNTIIIPSETNAMNYILFGNKITNDKSKQYKFTYNTSITLISSAMSILIRQYDINNNIITTGLRYNTWYRGHIRTLTENITLEDNCSYFYVGLTSGGVTGDGCTFSNIQLEIGAATPYEPYNGNTYTLPTGLTLNSVGDVKDEYDAASGKLTKKVGKATFDGSADEEWIRDTTESTDRMRFIIKAQDVLDSINPLQELSCDKFITRVGAHSDTEYITAINKNIYININKSRLSTQDTAGLKTFLQSNPVTVLYKLATPVITQVGTPQNILQNINTFADAGTVKTVSVQDVNKVISELRSLIVTP